MSEKSSGFDVEQNRTKASEELFSQQAVPLPPKSRQEEIDDHQSPSRTPEELFQQNIHEGSGRSSRPQTEHGSEHGEDDARSVLQSQPEPEQLQEAQSGKYSDGLSHNSKGYADNTLFSVSAGEEPVRAGDEGFFIAPPSNPI